MLLDVEQWHVVTKPDVEEWEVGKVVKTWCENNSIKNKSDN